MVNRFTQATSIEKKQAIGALTGSPILLRKLIEATEADFHDIPLPGPDDWLANNYEHGQTYDQFRSYANCITPGKNKFYIQPFDSKLSQRLLNILKEFSTAFFPGVNFIIRKPQNLEKIKVYPRNNEGLIQYKAGVILNKMHKIAPLDRFAIIGITSEDIYNREEGNFVFGLANAMSKTGVFSFARYTQQFYGLPEDEDLVLFRAVKVMLHEMCHMFGMLHCIYYRCLMNGSNHIGETDGKPPFLCPVCVRKLHLCLGGNCLDRYLNLADKCAETGGYFAQYAQWYRECAEKTQKILPKERKIKK